MAEADLAERLQALRLRVDRARAAQVPKPATPDHHGQAQIAWRMVTEMVAGIGLGLAIGYGLDAVFGTRPVMLLLFTLVGFAAGVRVMLRTAEEVNRQAGAIPPVQDERTREGRTDHG